MHQTTRYRHCKANILWYISILNGTETDQFLPMTMKWGSQEGSAKTETLLWLQVLLYLYCQLKPKILIHTAHNFFFIEIDNKHQQSKLV